MRTVLTIISFCFINICFTQKIQFNFNGKSYQCSSFEKLAQTENNSEFLISAFQYNTEATFKEGLRMVLSLHNVKQNIPLKEKDTLFMHKSNFEFYTAQRNQYKKASESKKFKSAKQSSNQIRNDVKSLEIKIKTLTQRVVKGDQSAMIELQKLIDQKTKIAERKIGNSDAKILPKFNENQPFYELTFFIPYGNKLEYEVKIFSGSLTILAISRKNIQLYFSGNAKMFYDDWDDKAKQDYISKNDATTFSKLLKEEGKISGVIQLIY
ncbi:hypothetical protein [Polaribacter sp. Z022]|uniref:hypothetical protein n=1 Tax=Polaribacter sp. Z022 TaxID=2927125 RepID=UPI00202084E6|nr:hypothetical protein [Polaribacter sp. Z022]MCL7753725.1 hypothetical protein [Polaribacter sp. Z022]